MEIAICINIIEVLPGWPKLMMMTEDRDKWRKYVHGVADRRIESG